MQFRTWGVEENRGWASWTRYNIRRCRQEQRDGDNYDYNEASRLSTRQFLLCRVFFPLINEYSASLFVTAIVSFLGFSFLFSCSNVWP
jgi:hypothetical protein